MRCVAHTLQLAVHDFLKDKSLHKLILKGKKVVKKLRTANLRYLLHAKNQSPPLLDVETRWGSCHDMLKSLLSLKGFCMEASPNPRTFPEIHLDQNTWNQIESLIAVLEPAKLATTIFQTETLTSGEFHENWTKMKMKLQSLNTARAKQLLLYVTTRETILLQNLGVVSAIYIDPRYKGLLNPVQLSDARHKLLTTAKILLDLKEIGSIPLTEQSSPSLAGVHQQGDSASNSDPDIDDMYETMLKHQVNNNDHSQSESDYRDARLTQLSNELFLFEKLPRLSDRKIDIFQWWENNSSASDLLKETAGVVLSFPVTQVSVERLFSGLRYILDPLRSTMKKNVIDSVMFLRMNKSFE